MFSKSVTEPNPDEVVQAILQVFQGTSEHSAAGAPFMLTAEIIEQRPRKNQS